MTDSITTRRLREWADLTDASVPESAATDADDDRPATTE
jgi:hypothetical protein